LPSIQGHIIRRCICVDSRQGHKQSLCCGRIIYALPSSERRENRVWHWEKEFVCLVDIRPCLDDLSKRTRNSRKNVYTY